MNSYFIQPGIGDIIYTLPVLSIINSEPFHIVTSLPQTYHNALKPLLLHQKYIAGVSHISEGFGKGLIDFNAFRHIKPAGRYLHLCERVAKSVDLKECVDFQNGWLQQYPVSTEIYAVISYTNRYRDDLYSWHHELGRLQNKYGTVYFIGDMQAWKDFQKVYGRYYASFLPTKDMNEAAQIIQNAQEVSTTQTSTLAICQGLPGRTYNFERSPILDTVAFFTDREQILNPYTRKMCAIQNRIVNAIKLIKA